MPIKEIEPTSTYNKDSSQNPEIIQPKIEGKLDNASNRKNDNNEITYLQYNILNQFALRRIIGIIVKASAFFSKMRALND